MTINLKEFTVYRDLKCTKSYQINFQDNLAEFVYQYGGGLI